MKIKHREFLSTITRSVHASTIAFFRNKPVFAWFGGVREGLADSSIYIQKGNQKATIGANIRVPFWNPILFPYQGNLFIFTKKGEFCDRWQTEIFDISNIKNIYKVCDLPAGCNGPVKTKPCVHNGSIYCGSSVETRWDWSSYIEEYKIRDDSFKCVSRSIPLTVPKVKYDVDVDGEIVSRNTAGIIQPSIWVDCGGNMHAFCRSSKGLGKIYHTFSWEWEPNVWSDPQPTKFANPNSSVDTVYFNERLFLVYNPSSEYRMPLVVVELNDKFEIMDYVVIREEVDEKVGFNTQELSYPYMIEHDGELHLTYTHGRQKIEYVTIEV